MDIETIRRHKVCSVLQFSVPSIIAMVLTAMINIVDGIFTGKFVGAVAMSAIELGLPIIYLYLAFGLMISVGGIAIAGRLYGNGEREKARNVFNQSMAVCLLISLVLSVAFFICMDGLIALMHIDSALASAFKSYYLIMLLELPVMIMNSSLGMFIRGDGHPEFFMLTSILTLVTNTVLDYLFSACLFLGIEGIAYASLFSSLIALALNILFINHKGEVYRFSRFPFDKSVQKEMILNGGSEFIGEMTMFFSMVAYNFIILRLFGVAVLTSFTIVGFISYIYSMIVIGFGQGIVPLVSFSFGAGDRVCARMLSRIASRLVIGTSLFIMLIMLFSSRPYCSLFIADEKIIAIAVVGILIQMLSFPLSGFNTIASMYFTAIGGVKESAVISSARGFVILLPAIFILPSLLGVNGIWLVSLSTESITLLLSLGYYCKDRQRIGVAK